MRGQQNKKQHFFGGGGVGGGGTTPGRAMGRQKPARGTLSTTGPEAQLENAPICKSARPGGPQGGGARRQFRYAVGRPREHDLPGGGGGGVRGRVMSADGGRGPLRT